MRVRTSLALLIAASTAFGATACNFTQGGLDPDPTTMNFPIAVELHQPDPTMEADYLFVVNSNFDLRFNTGTLQAIEIGAMNAVIDDCEGGPGDDCLLDELTFTTDLGQGGHPIIADEVGIGSHADGLAMDPEQGRLYLPVRATRDLTTVDFAGGQFSCGQTYRDEVSAGTERWDAGDVQRCADAHRITRREAVANERELDLVGDPVAIAVVPSTDLGDTDFGDFILLVLREGRVALLLDDHSQNTPELLHIADGFPQNLVTLTMEPGRGIGWLTAVGTNELARVGIIVDATSPARSFVYDAGRLRLGGVDDGEDTRDFAFHPTRPDTAFVLSRRPESVIEVDLARRGLTSVDLGLRNIYEVGRGPSRLTTVVLDGRTYVLASCFDAQRLFIIDAEIGALVAVIGGFSGPFELAIDEFSQRLYMVDFSVSVIRVLDLSPLLSGGIPSLIATLGNPTPIVSLTGT